MKKLRRSAATYAGEFAEQSSEAACACAIMMVQGQLLALSAAHWVIALQTGLVSGALATALIIIARVTRPWVIAVVLGVVTAVVDYFVHSGGPFIPGFIEALLTGLGAGSLSLLVTLALRQLIRRWRSARTAQSPN